MTTNTPNGAAFLEGIADYQKKMLEVGSQMTQQLMGMGANTTATNVFSDLYQKQMDWLKQMSGNSDFQNLFANSPEQLKHWMDMQTEFFNKYAKAFTPSNQYPDWIQSMVSKSFSPISLDSIFQQFKPNWENLQKSIQFGVYDPNVLSQWFSIDKAKDTVARLMGMNMIPDVSILSKEVNSYFDQFIENYRKGAEQVTTFLAQNSPSNANFLSPNGSVALDSIMSFFNDQVSKTISPLTQLYPVKERDEIVEGIRNVQFAFLAFISKSVAIQNMMIEAGSGVLPEVVKHFYNQYSETKQLPDYDTFFQKLINATEEKMLVVMNSQAYSNLQAEMATALVSSRKEVEKLKELIFDGLPYVKYSEFDDVLLEISTLKRKNRKLESRLASLATDSKAPESSTQVESLLKQVEALQAKVASVDALSAKIEALQQQLATLAAAPAPVVQVTEEVSAPKKVSKSKKAEA
jgi:Poly(R)-hydroxyalkanoic acid synthase subunit (PHA_synth_III_E)